MMIEDCYDARWICLCWFYQPRFFGEITKPEQRKELGIELVDGVKDF
jgi:hypothetical protein